MTTDYRALLARAERLLSNQVSATVHLQLGKVFQRRFSVALRCQATGLAATSVIVKQTLPVSGLPNHERNMLLNEWAASLFLNRLNHDPPLAPQVYAGDTDQNLVILEEIGEGTDPNTAELLQGDDPDRAEQGLLKHVALLGRLHARTMGSTRLAQRWALSPTPMLYPAFR